MLSKYPIGTVLLSTDLQKSRAFYADALQLEILEESDSAIAYAASGDTRITVTSSTTGSNDEQTKAAWRVDDLRAELEWLKSRGVTPEDYDTDELKTVDGIADRGTVWAAWILDPDGNALGVEQEK
ncbi:VOC family protein [Conyzicola nivalis]|uniref:Glyoxalase n=1 Tax=Conyzicola nivalis TaxID=1477021 RepID=A0A916SJI3_9MICO|nr:VOC family protein [Conyzicola nivalis]GGB03927.1 glyoxalase [Conyzicola nivalis]